MRTAHLGMLAGALAATMGSPAAAPRAATASVPRRKGRRGRSYRKPPRVKNGPSKQESRRSGGRPRVIRHIAGSVNPVGAPRPDDRTQAGAKRDFMRAARENGWGGRSYRSAKKYDRLLSWLRRAAFGRGAP